MLVTVYKDQKEAYTVDAVSGKFMQATVPYIQNNGDIKFERSGYITLELRNELRCEYPVNDGPVHIIDMKDSVKLGNGITYNMSNVEKMGQFFNQFIVQTHLDMLPQ